MPEGIDEQQRVEQPTPVEGETVEKEGLEQAPETPEEETVQSLSEKSQDMMKDVIRDVDAEHTLQFYVVTRAMRNLEDQIPERSRVREAFNELQDKWKMLNTTMSDLENRLRENSSSLENASSAQTVPEDKNKPYQDLAALLDSRDYEVRELVSEIKKFVEEATYGAMDTMNRWAQDDTNPYTFDGGYPNTFHDDFLGELNRIKMALDELPVVFGITLQKWEERFYEVKGAVARIVSPPAPKA